MFTIVIFDHTNSSPPLAPSLSSSSSFVWLFGQVCGEPSVWAACGGGWLHHSSLVKRPPARASLIWGSVSVTLLCSPALLSQNEIIQGMRKKRDAPNAERCFSLTWHSFYQVKIRFILKTMSCNFFDQSDIDTSVFWQNVQFQNSPYIYFEMSIYMVYSGAWSYASHKTWLCML